MLAKAGAKEAAEARQRCFINFNRLLRARPGSLPFLLPSHCLCNCLCDETASRARGGGSDAGVLWKARAAKAARVAKGSGGSTWPAAVVRQVYLAQCRVDV